MLVTKRGLAFLNVLTLEKVRALTVGFLCAISVSSVSLWFLAVINHRDREDTEVAQRI